MTKVLLTIGVPNLWICKITPWAENSLQVTTQKEEQ